MNFLIFILVIVCIYKLYSIFMREGFEGNCYKNADLFNNSDLTYTNIKLLLDESSEDNPDITTNIEEYKTVDFENTTSQIDEYFKKIEDNDNFDSTNCTLDYLY